jgi:hypothetical protein
MPSQLTRKHHSRNWIFAAIRISSFLSIAAGLVGLVLLRVDTVPPPLRAMALPMDYALGLIFAGFALRMARLERHSPLVRVIVRTSRWCLIALGASLAAGASISGLLGLPTSDNPAANSHLPVGMAFLLFGSTLNSRLQSHSTKLPILLALGLNALLSASWISVILDASGAATAPALLQMPFTVLIICSAMAYILWRFLRGLGTLQLLPESSPESEATRVLLPVAIAMPICLAILRHQAESHGLIRPEMALLLHVLLSAGGVVALIVWNAHRISSALRIEDDESFRLSDDDTTWLSVLGCVSQPVWVLSGNGDVLFRNAHACQFVSLDDNSIVQQGLSNTQRSAIVRAEVLGNRVEKLSLRRIESLEPFVLKIVALKTLYSAASHPRLIVVVGHSDSPLLALPPSASSVEKSRSATQS